MLSFILQKLGAYLTAALVLLCTAFYFYLKKKYRYWEEVGIRGPKPTMIFGNMKNVFTLKQTEPECLHDIHKEYEKEGFVGIYNLWKPTLLVTDLNLIKAITETDFSHFMDHPEVRGHSETDSVFDSLFLMKGLRWKQRRQYFTKLFTSKKLKEYVNDLQTGLKHLTNQIAKDVVSQRDSELLDIFDKSSVHNISATLYGIDITNNEKVTSKMINLGLIFSHPPFHTVLKFLFYSVSPTLYNLLRLRTLPAPIWEFYSTLTKELILNRNNSNITRTDLVALVKDLREKGSSDFEKISFSEAVGHIYIFTLGAHHTSQMVLCHALVQLSLHPDIQGKAISEVDEVTKGSTAISYDDVTKMTYLECIINETMRLFSLVGVQKRTCTKPYKLTDNFTIPVGMDIFYCAHTLQTDEKYFPEPDKFKPERFLENNEKKNPAFMPFGKGPRLCIGSRFGELVTRLTLAQILSEFTVKPSDNMKFPMKFDPKTMFITNRPYGGMWVKFQKRTKAEL